MLCKHCKTEIGKAKKCPSCGKSQKAKASAETKSSEKKEAKPVEKKDEVKEEVSKTKDEADKNSTKTGDKDMNKEEKNKEEKIEEEKEITEAEAVEEFEKLHEPKELTSRQKSKKNAKIGIVIVAVIIIALLLKGLLSLLFGFSSSTFGVPTIANKDGNTYALIGGKMHQIYDKELKNNYTIETSKYILFESKNDENKEIKVYSKSRRNMFELDDIIDYQISANGKKITVLNSKNELLLFGNILNIENLKPIQKNVDKYAISDDFNSIFVSQDGTLKQITNSGKDKGFSKNNVIDFGIEGNKYIAYASQKDDGSLNLNVFDLRADREVYSDKIDSFDGLSLVNKDGSIIVYTGGDSKNIVIRPSKQDTVDAGYYVPLASSLYPETMSLSVILANEFNARADYYNNYKSPILLNDRVVVNIDNFEDEDYDRLFLYNSRIVAQDDDDEITILHPKNLNEMQTFNIDLSDEEYIEEVYAIDNDEIYVDTNENLYYYNKDKKTDLKVKNSDYLIANFDKNFNHSIYVFEDDEAFVIDRDNKVKLYDGNAIMLIDTIYNSDGSSSVVFTTDKDELYYVSGTMIKKISDKFESCSVLETKTAVAFDQDGQTYILKDNKVIKVGENFEFK